MAYARFSNADVYVYMDVNGSLACSGCWLGGEWYFDSTQAMVDHLRKHREAGHDVPEDLEELLWHDDKENFPPQCADGHDWGEPYRPYADHPVQDWISQNVWRRKCSRCDWEDHMYKEEEHGTEATAEG